MDSFSDASVNLSNFLGSVHHEAICMLRQHQVSLLLAVRQGEQTMKVPHNALIWCLLIVCIPVILQVACALAFLAHPSHLLK